MVFELIFDPVATDEMNKLESSIKKRIYDKLVISKQNPYRYFNRLVGRPEYSLHVGSYRALVLIENKKINVLHVAHRKNVYE